MERVFTSSVVGGTISELNGGRFADGFKKAFAMSALTFANYLMRQEVVANSSINPDNINGESDGFFGDNKKLAGARRVLADIPCDSLMGGCQGARLAPDDVRSSFFGFEYSRGSIFDQINESFAGPHDWLRNATGSYNAFGNGIDFTGFRASIDTVMNYALVVPAAPLAISGLIMTNPAAMSVVLSQR